MTNPLRLGIFSALQNVEEKRSARADKARQVQMQQDAIRQQAEDRKRKQMLEDLVTDRQMRDAGYVPDAERGPDAQLSGQSLDQIVGLGTGMPVVGMKGTEQRYGSSVGGYTYDRMNPKRQSQLLEERLKEAQAAKYEHDAREPYKTAATETPSWETKETDAGYVQVNPKTGATRPLGIKPPPKEKKEPTPKQPNESNTKAAGMLHRVIPAGQALNKFDDRKTLDALAAKGGMLGNWASTPEGRQLTAAGDAWIFGVLRPESGATIGDKEREVYNRTYIQQPGDDEKTLAMKRQNRRLAEEGVAIQAGPAFTGGPRSAMEADSLANPAEFTKKYHGGANVDEDRAAAILKKHGVR